MTYSNLTHSLARTLPPPFESAPRIGMGCWAIGGPFFAGDAHLGWGETDDATSRATIDAAWEAGIRVFDTADAYGAGHSETLLGQTLSGKPDAVIVSKFGNAFDPTTKQITGLRHDPDYIRGAIDASLTRLQRDRIDVILLHINDLPVNEAGPVFDTLDALRSEGAIGAYGWSTDYPDRLASIADRPGCVAVEHAANVLLATPTMNSVAQSHYVAQLVRSPLAMGLLTGKYGPGDQIAADDVRNYSSGWNDWFTDRAASPHHVKNVNSVKDILTANGRSLAQGSLCWLLAHSPLMVPVPGARTPAQVIDNAGAMAHGPLSASEMNEIERLLNRPPEEPARPR